MLSNGSERPRTPSNETLQTDRLWDQKFPVYLGQYNCYDYATSGADRLPPDHSIRPSHPGLVGGLPLHRRNYDRVATSDGTFFVDEAIAALNSDGLIFIPTEPTSKMPNDIGGHHLIAFVIDNRPPKVDYHFYRRDEGVWSHKFSNCPVSRVDASEKPIMDPRTSDRDYTKCIIDGFRGERIYETFVGFLYAPDTALTRRT